MTFQRIVIGLGAIAATYLVAFILLAVLLSFMASGSPELDARNASLAMMNLLAKVALAAAIGLSAGFVFIRSGWWVGAIAMAALIVCATFLFPRSFLLAIFATDDVAFDVIYVLVAAAGGKVGELIAQRKVIKQ
jgi:hypothetical protein